MRTYNEREEKENEKVIVLTILFRCVTYLDEIKEKLKGHSLACIRSILLTKHKIKFERKRQSCITFSQTNEETNVTIKLKKYILQLYVFPYLSMQ